MYQILLLVAAVSAPAPRLSAARVEGEDLYLVDVTTVFVPFQTKVQVREGGAVREKVVTEYRPVYDMRTSRYPLREVKVYGTDGKPRDGKCLPNRLKDLAPVLVSADGKPVDPLYLRAIREDTVILVLPPNRAGPRPKEPARPSAPGKRG